MGVYIDKKKPGIIAEPKTIHCDLPMEVSNSLKHEIDDIINQN